MDNLEKIDLDLEAHKVRMKFQDRTEPLIIHFDTSARRYYFALICLVAAEMKHRNQPDFIHIRKHEQTLRMLDLSIAGPSASKSVESMWEKVRKAWRYKLPDLESGVVFTVLDRDLIVPYEKGGKCRYDCAEDESDVWATLFAHDERNKWRFKLAIDALSLELSDLRLSFNDLQDASAWQAYLQRCEGKGGACHPAEVEPQIVCPDCGAPIMDGIDFCDRCARELKQAPGTLAAADGDLRVDISEVWSRKPLIDPSASPGERKMVTVLQAAVADAAGIAAGRDPEEIHQIMSGAFKILVDQVQRYDGTLSQITQDGAMALFGAPAAQEDHARRACYAALSIQHAIGWYARELKAQLDIDFRLCIGLNSGLVLVGGREDGSGQSNVAVADTTYLAAGVRQRAKPGAVCVSQSTYSLAQPYFEFRAAGRLAAKGANKPSKIYELFQPGRFEARIEVAEARGFTPFVGRQNTIPKLLGLYARAQAGAGQAVLLSGEAGVGKSRVLREFHKRLAAGEFSYLEGKCQHHGLTMPYLPVIDMLRAYFALQPDERQDTVRNKIEAGFKGFGLRLTESVGLLQALLSAGSEDAHYRQLDPQQRRKLTFGALRELFAAASRQKTLVVAVEDFQWADRTSEEFFLHFINHLDTQKTLLILVARPEFTHQFDERPHFTPIELSRLTPQSSLQMIHAVLGSNRTDPGLEAFILDRSAGNPLFIEELTHSLAGAKGRGAGRRPLCAGPGSLQDKGAGDHPRHHRRAHRSSGRQPQGHRPGRRRDRAFVRPGSAPGRDRYAKSTRLPAPAPAGARFHL